MRDEIAPLNFGSCIEANPYIFISSKKEKRGKFRSFLEDMKIQQLAFEFSLPLILFDQQIFRFSDGPVLNLLSFCVIRKEK